MFPALICSLNKSFVSACNQVNQQPLVRKVFKERRGRKRVGARRWVVESLGRGQDRARNEPELFLCTTKKA